MVCGWLERKDWFWKQLQPVQN